MSNYNIVEYASRPTAIVRGRVKKEDLQSFFEHNLPLVLGAIEAQGAIRGGEPFAYYHGVPDGSVDVEAGFPVVGVFAASGDIVPGRLPGGRVVTTLHLGTYDGIGRTYAGMAAWAMAHGLRPTEDRWEVYLTDPECETSPEHWRTGLFLRVE
jgi:effector-binding domain-containing protein